MARSYAALLISIWDDEDFADLSETAQRVYLFLISQREMTFCGVIVINDTRWAKKAKTATRESIWRDLGELNERGFVAYDDRTDEVWVRSFMKHNKVIDQPKLLAAARRQVGEIRSINLQQLVTIELNKCELARINDEANAGQRGTDTPAKPSVLSVLNKEREKVKPVAFEQLFDQALRVLCRRKLAGRRGRPVERFDPWFAKARPDLVKAHESQARALYGSQSGISAEALADALEQASEPHKAIQRAERSRFAASETQEAEINAVYANGPRNPTVARSAIAEMRELYAKKPEEEPMGEAE